MSDSIESLRGQLAEADREIERLRLMLRMLELDPEQEAVPMARYKHDVLSLTSGFMAAMSVAGDALYAIDMGLKKGMHHSRKDLEAHLKMGMEKFSACSLNPTQYACLPLVDIRPLVSALQFIKNECDWRRGSGGDWRIGETIMKTLADLRAKYPDLIAP